jgi:hypothetical protein
MFQMKVIVFLKMNFNISLHAPRFVSFQNYDHKLMITRIIKIFECLGIKYDLNNRYIIMIMN